MKAKWALLAIPLTAILTAIGCGQKDPYRSEARRDWKESAIKDITSRRANPGWITNRLNTLKRESGPAQLITDGWFTMGLLVFQNGEWMTFTNKCNKEDSNILDIFIGQGSDGKWYYSTYHFCVGMVALMAEDQPASLTGFRNSCYLREFDGRSDDCLNKTWPPEQL